jgi:hypothetical protein
MNWLGSGNLKEAELEEHRTLGGVGGAPSNDVR